MEEWVTIIKEIGFPVFVSFYLLHRIEAKLDAIYNALVSLNKTNL